MGRVATYACLSLPGANKVSKMQADESGYYRCIVGGFNICNESGKFYHLTESVKAMFEKGGIVRRRLDRGYLRGELDHPNLQGMSLQNALQRLAQIDPARVSHHFKSLELIEKKDHQGKPTVLVYAMVKPSGPYASSLESSLNNPEENVAFSVRSFSRPGVHNGRTGTIVTDVLTYDYVSEPGIRAANKFDTVNLESLKMLSGETLEFTDGDLNSAIRTCATEGLENEATTLTMVKDHLGWNKVELMNVSSLDW